MPIYKVTATRDGRLVRSENVQAPSRKVAETLFRQFNRKLVSHKSGCESIALHAVSIHRVWIELEADEDAAVNVERAKMASAMLQRLHAPGERALDRVFWNESAGRFCFTLDDSGTYVEATDGGHWYNLEYFSRTA